MDQFIDAEDFLDQFIAGGINYLEALPIELVAYVLTFLTLSDLKNVAVTSRLLSKATCDSQLWRHRCLDRFATKLMPVPIEGWKELFRRGLGMERSWRSQDASGCFCVNPFSSVLADDALEHILMVPAVACTEWTVMSFREGVMRRHSLVASEEQAQVLSVRMTKHALLVLASKAISVYDSQGFSRTKLLMPESRHVSFTVLAYDAIHQDVFAGATDGLIHVWELRRDSASGTFKGHKATITSIVAVPGSHLVSGDERGEVRLWTRQVVVDMKRFYECAVVIQPHYGPISNLFLASEDRTLITSHLGSVKVWDVPKLTQQHAFQDALVTPAQPNRVTMHSDLLLSTSAQNIFIWNIHSGEEVQHLAEANTGAALCDPLLAVANGTQVRLLNIYSRSVIAALHPWPDPITALLFSPLRLIGVSRTAVALWTPLSVPLRLRRPIKRPPLLYYHDAKKARQTRNDFVEEL